MLILPGARRDKSEIKLVLGTLKSMTKISECNFACGMTERNRGNHYDIYK